MRIVFSKFLDKLNLILESGNIGLRPVESRWPTYEVILSRSIMWADHFRPIMLPEGGARLSQWPELARNSEEWLHAGFRRRPGFLLVPK
jgi:hypothetical protein